MYVYHLVIPLFIFSLSITYFRLGWIIRFISHAVISGFTTASAIVIALSQAKYFLGYSVDSTTEIVPLIESIISGRSGVRMISLL